MWFDWLVSKPRSVLVSDQAHKACVLVTLVYAISNFTSYYMVIKLFFFYLPPMLCSFTIDVALAYALKLL